MPTYEYVCKSCGTHLEVTQSFSDEALRECSACGGELKKVFGNVGIVFKGSGFYKTDSRGSASSSSSVSASDQSTKSTASEPASSGPSSEASSSPAPAAATSAATSAGGSSTS